MAMFRGRGGGDVASPKKVGLPSQFLFYSSVHFFMRHMWNNTERKKT
jgi:hypothetical protein